MALWRFSRIHSVGRVSHIGIAMVLIVAALLVAGCSSKEATVEMTLEQRYEAAMKLFNDGDYREAIDAFRIITLQFQGSALADDAQYYLAESHYCAGEYVLAAYEFETLYKTMPTSEYVPRARFERALCYFELSPKASLDQDYTRKAIDEFQAFIEYYPTDPRVPEAEAKIAELNTKLAKKMYDSAVIYMKMEYYRSAAVYFDLVLERYHDTQYAEPALLAKAEALAARKQYEEARESLELYLERYPQSPERSDAESLLNSVKEALVARVQKSATMLQTKTPGSSEVSGEGRPR
jgi:outer membrane protein assembly factor BamD